MVTPLKIKCDTGLSYTVLIDIQMSKLITPFHTTDHTAEIEFSKIFIYPEIVNSRPFYRQFFDSRPDETL